MGRLLACPASSTGLRWRQNNRYAEGELIQALDSTAVLRRPEATRNARNITERERGVSKNRPGGRWGTRSDQR